MAVSGTASILAAKSDDEKGPKRFYAELYTGGELMVDGYDLPVVIDLAGMQFARKMLANLEHVRAQRVGQITSHEIAEGKLVVEGVANASTQYRDEVINSAADGFEWEVSIEAQPLVLNEVAAGATVSVNGREFEGPLYVAAQSKVMGMGFVTLGADEHNTTKIAAAAKGTEMNEDLRAFIADCGFDPDAVSDKQLAFLKASFEGKPSKRRSDDEDDLTTVVARKKAERQRRQQINELVATYCDRVPEWQIDELHQIAAEAIEHKWSVDKLKIELFESVMPAAPPIVSGRGSNQMDAKVVEAAICRNGNLPSLEKHYDDRTLEAADRKYATMGLNELFIVAARANGYQGSATKVNRDVLEAAFSKPSRMVSAAGFSTTSLPGMLSNIANKFLLAGWEGGDMTWSRISQIQSVSDFKTRTSYRLNGYLSYEKVGATGEIKHGQVSEETYTIQADTYARMLAITRRDFINDDLGALTQVPRELGFAAIEKLNQVFWTEFLGAFAADFFSAANNNVSSGVFGTTSVESANAAFLKQTKPNGEPLAVVPEILLVPPELKMAARAIVNSSLIVTGANTTLPSGNVWEGMFRVESAPYMSNSNYTGQSSAAYYMLANPNRMATIATAFLNGRQAPAIETTDADFNTLGVQMRGYHDFGVSLQEPRAGVRSTGA